MAMSPEANYFSISMAVLVGVLFGHLLTLFLLWFFDKYGRFK